VSVISLDGDVLFPSRLGQFIDKLINIIFSQNRFYFIPFNIYTPFPPPPPLFRNKKAETTETADTERPKQPK
jgi:hypothetical protein